MPAPVNNVPASLMLWETSVALPTFKYHLDPVATGNVVKSETECACCGKARGFIYTGPVYAVEEYDQCICPWCIADGSAHEKLAASFTDDAGIGGGGMWDEVSEEVIEEVAYRTPRFLRLAARANGGPIAATLPSSLGGPVVRSCKLSGPKRSRRFRTPLRGPTGQNGMSSWLRWTKKVHQRRTCSAAGNVASSVVTKTVTEKILTGS